MSTSRSRSLVGLGQRPGADRGSGTASSRACRTICRPRSSCRATPLTEAGPGDRGARRARSTPAPTARSAGCTGSTAASTRRCASTPRRPQADTSAEQAAAAGHGVCQDFAHIFIAAARLLGIPARYVSGHLFRRDGAHAQEAAHAWAEAWVGDLGWVAFDPANGICADDAYVRVACGLDYRDAAPVAGARSGGGAERI